MKQNIKKALAVGILAASSSYAMAIPTFTFNESAGFVGGDVAIADYTGALPVGDPNPSVQTYSSMEWYNVNDADDRSTLDLASFSGALDSTLGVWTTISTLTHTNVPITSNPAQGWGDDAQTILGRLIISDEGGEVLNDEDPITIDLTETLNQAPCTIPNPSGSEIPCDDFFTFTAIGLASLDFTASDGSKWIVDFRLANFVNSAEGPGGIYTSEEAVSSLDVQMTLRAAPVPEPATLSMFGLGLLGLGMAKRRKQQA